MHNKYHIHSGRILEIVSSATIDLKRCSHFIGVAFVQIFIIRYHKAPTFLVMSPDVHDITIQQALIVRFKDCIIGSQAKL